MEQRITRNYINPKLQIALNDWRTGYRLIPEPVPLITEVYKGNLVYRAKGSSQRVSYNLIKNGLIKRTLL